MIKKGNKNGKKRINLIEQNNNAFDYIEKLYLETSYLIKEVAGILEDEEENFLIGKPSGFQISSTASSGLEPNYVKSWLLKKFSVFLWIIRKQILEEVLRLRI